MRSPSVLGRGAAAFGRSREVAALVVWTLAVFLGLALASYPQPNWVGPVGEVFAGWLASLVGIVAWALPLELFLLGIPLVRGKESAATPGRVAGDLLMAVVAAALVQVG
ncbi:MAG TPA: DNA translocase FtsK 4TM domain-containing protein, partial [Polyangiaceae bacterium]